MGQRKLMQYIRQPLLEVEEIDKRLNLVDFFVSSTEIRGSMTVIHLFQKNL